MSGTAAFQCKGSHVLQAQRVIDAKLGVGTFQSLVADAGPEWQVVTASAWLDLDVLVQALAEAAKRAGTTLAELTQEVASENARQDLRGIYKVFLRILQPRVVLSQLPMIWSMYFRFGEVKVLSNEPGRLLMETRGVPARYVEWVTGGWRGFLPVTVESSGGASPELKTLKVEQAPGSNLLVVGIELTYA